MTIMSIVSKIVVLIQPLYLQLGELAKTQNVHYFLLYIHQQKCSEIIATIDSEHLYTRYMQLNRNVMQ